MGPRIYPSYQDTNITAKGSLIVNYDDYYKFNGNHYVNVYVNNIQRNTLNEALNGYYTTDLLVGDVVKFELISTKLSFIDYINYRRDYTTDDTNNNDGIRDVFIESGQTIESGITIYSFTAATSYDAYNFEYRMDIYSSIACMDIDPGFGGQYNRVYDIDLNSDLSGFYGGEFNSYNNTYPTFGLVKLNYDGTLVTSFTPNITGIYGYHYVYNINKQSTGKRIIGGQFTSAFGNTYRSIFRMTTGDTIDNTFGIGIGNGYTADTFDYTVRVKSLAIDSSDRLYVMVYAFDTPPKYNGTLVPRYHRLTADGSIDNTFINPLSGITSNVDLYAVHNDDLGNIFVSTTFNFYKLQSSGAIDYTFTGTTASYVNNIIRLSSGKYLVCSSNNTVTTSGGTINTGFIYRLNSNGTFDSTFNTGNVGADSVISDMAVFNDGKIAICGTFNTYNGVSSKRFAILNSDGTLFLSSELFKDEAHYIPPTPLILKYIPTKDKLLIGGEFDYVYQDGNFYLSEGLTRIDVSGLLNICDRIPDPTPTPFPTSTPTPTPTVTPLPPTATPTPTGPTPTPTPTPTQSPSLPMIITSGLTMYLDGGGDSYPGFGNIWYNRVTGFTGATLYNSPTFATADNGYFSFNGVNQYGDCGSQTSSSGLGASVTFGGWVNNFHTGSTSEVVFQNGNDTNWSLNLLVLQNQFRINIKVAGNNSYLLEAYPPYLSSINWYYVTVVRTGNNDISVYINGVYINGMLRPENLFSSTGWLLSKQGSDHDISRIGSFELYNRALSGAEVLSNFNAKKSLYGY